MNLVTPETRERLETHHPEALREIENLERVLDETTIDAGLLTLCGDYFEATIRNKEWLPPEELSDLEATCLDVCEQFTLSVADVRDEQIAALRLHLSTDDVYNLMHAIYLIEMSKRLDLTMERALI